MPPVFRFAGEYAPTQGLAFRVSLYAPGNWSTANFIGAIESFTGGSLGAWEFGTPVYNTTTDETLIPCSLSRTTTAALPLNESNFDILGRFPNQEPVLLLRGKIAPADLYSNPTTLIGGGATNGSYTPEVQVRVTVTGLVSIAGATGFSSAAVDAAIATYLVANPGQVVSGVASLNGLAGALTIAAGSNVTLTATGSAITINSTATGGLTQQQGDARYRLQSVALTDGDIPATIARDSEVTTAIAGVTPASIGALTQATADGRYRLQSVALTDSDIPATIARDSEVTAAIATVTPASIGALTQATADGRYRLQSVAIDYATLTNLPTLGTAAAQNSTAFATAAQGTLASTALQPGAIGSTVQAYDADLLAIAALSGTGVAQRTGVNTWTLTTLATVATSGAYTDLSGRPTLAAVATSGSYNDLSNLPTLGTAAAQNTAFFLQAANNLSDLGSASTARTNLGLGTAATQASTAFATAAQGALADTALQPSSATAIRDALQTLSGGDRLPATAIRDLPAGGNGPIAVYETKAAVLTGTTARTQVASLNVLNLVNGNRVHLLFCGRIRSGNFNGTDSFSIDVGSERPISFNDSVFVAPYYISDYLVIGGSLFGKNQGNDVLPNNSYNSWFVMSNSLASVNFSVFARLGTTASVFAAEIFRIEVYE